MAGASPPTPKRESFASAGKLRADTEEELVATKELLKQGTTMEKMTALHGRRRQLEEKELAKLAHNATAEAKNEARKKARNDPEWARDAAELAGLLLTRVQLDKGYRRIRMRERRAKVPEGEAKDSKACCGACKRDGAPGQRKWCKGWEQTEAAPCLCGDMALSGYEPDDWDWLTLDQRSCQDHFCWDAHSALILAQTMRIDQERLDETDKRERLLMAVGLMVRTRDVEVGDERWSFWSKALPAVGAWGGGFQREELKAVLHKAWEDGEKHGQHLLNRPLVNAVNYNTERTQPKDERNPEADREERWRKARHAYTAKLLDSLEDLWDERRALLEAGAQEHWGPFLKHVDKLTGFGELTSGVLADHLRRTCFFCAKGLARDPVSKCLRMADDREYCYFGSTGATDGLAVVLGLEKASAGSMEEAEKREWMKRIFQVQERLLPASILQEKQPEPELQCTEFSLCELQKVPHELCRKLKKVESKTSYPLEHLTRERKSAAPSQPREKKRKAEELLEGPTMRPEISSTAETSTGDEGIEDELGHEMRKRRLRSGADRWPRGGWESKLEAEERKQVDELKDRAAGLERRWDWAKKQKDGAEDANRYYEKLCKVCALAHELRERTAAKTQKAREGARRTWQEVCLVLAELKKMERDERVERAMRHATKAEKSIQDVVHALYPDGAEERLWKDVEMAGSRGARDGTSSSARHSVRWRTEFAAFWCDQSLKA